MALVVWYTVEAGDGGLGWVGVPLEFEVWKRGELANTRTYRYFAELN